MASLQQRDTAHQCPSASVVPAGDMQNSLPNMSATLIDGRDALPERLVVIAATADELCAHLSAFLNGLPPNPESVFHGKAKRQRTRSKLNRELRGQDLMTEAARLWVSDRAFELTWHDLYATHAAPKRCPLPTYPFALERVWFSQPLTSADTQATTPTATDRNLAPILEHNPSMDVLKHRSPNEHQVSARERQPTPVGQSHNDGPCAAWRKSWVPAHAPPVSVMSLPVLLRTTNRPTTIEDIAFSTPLDDVGEGFRCTTGSQSGQAIVQCHTRRDQPSPLVQGQLSANPKAMAREFLDEMMGAEAVSPSAFYRSGLNVGLNPTQAAQVVTDCVVVRDALRLTLQAIDAHAEPGRFWACLMSTIILGTTYLENSTTHDQAVYLPMRIETATLAKAAAASIHRIDLIRQSPKTFDVTAFDASGIAVLTLDTMRVGKFASALQPEHERTSRTTRDRVLEAV
ncbi:MAG: hypothetical protein AAFO75_07650 [Pseudomonadota bacterium]